MDYKEKVIALLNSHELSNEQKEKLELIFLELKESEDEKIRKALLNEFIHLQSKGYKFAGLEGEEIIAWLEKQCDANKEYWRGYREGMEEIIDKYAELEKQGKQKPTDKVEPKFNVGDKIQYLKGCGTIMTIEKIENDEYIFANNLGHTTIEDGNKWYLVECNPTWSEEDEIGLCDTLWCIKQASRIAKDENEMGSCWYAENWLKSLKDRIQPQPKQEWSEEDDIMVENIRNSFGLHCGQMTEALKKQYDKFFNKVKSLRPQPHWKQSDLPHWKKSTLPNDNTTYFNSDYFCYKGYNINYKELFEKLPKDD